MPSPNPTESEQALDATQPQISRDRTEVQVVLDDAEATMRHPASSEPARAAAEAVNGFYLWLVGATHEQPRF